VGALTAPFGGPVLMIAAYFLARSAHALARAQGTALGARRWLIDPPLLLFALPMAVVLFFGPVPAVVPWGIEDGGFLRLAHVEADVPTPQRVRVYAALTAMAAGGWWMLLAAASAAGIRAVRALLFPLANGLRRTHLAWLAATGFVLVAAGAASLWL
jgi:hypothetical protein